MKPPGDYRLGKPLHSSALTEVCLGVRESDGREVVLKRYLAESSSDGSSCARREFEALRAVAGTGVPEALELDVGEEGAVLVQSRAPGIAMAQWISAGPAGTAAFIELAMQLADVLTRVHGARFVHRDVSPNNIVIDPATLQTHLVDFGLARRLGASSRPVEGAGTGAGEASLVGTLPYISPEQSGRMDRGVDSRSDLYSLGAVFHHVLTGRPPFESDDPLTLIHAHMARVPPSVLELRPEIPATLSRIVAKLLQKEPEDRYQTARALHRDLRECKEQLERSGLIADDLPLGTADAPYRPLFPRRVYGRDAELRALHDTYARAATGVPSVLFIEGAPGVGKSALVGELRKPLAQSGGYLAQGKFDLYRREIPYSGFLQAFESFTQQILTESDARLAHWRSELSRALGGIGRVLVDLVPDLAAVLGETPLVPPLGPSETLARLSLAIQRFVQAVATPDHPLVLFLDDVHWADAGSRDLLRDLLLQLESCSLLVLGAYRDGEVDAAHPLRHLIAELAERGRSVTTLTLPALSEAACAQMLADALGRTPEDARPLAACIGRRTGNSPLMIQQFVEHLYDQGVIRFESGRGWSWDEHALAAADIPEDAVALMTAKIVRLDEQSRQVLKLASCVGDRFDARSLAELAGMELGMVEPALLRLAEEGLLAPCPEGLRFVHDRVREAAHFLLPEADRQALHDRVGRRLLARTPAEALDEHLLEILDHLNRARDHIGDDQDRRQRIELNLRAGRRALRAGAAIAAERYFAAGRASFLESDWAEDPRTSFELHALSAECAFASRRHEDALAWLDLLDGRPALTPLDIARIAAQRTSVYALIRSQREAADAGLAGLARLGLRLPAEPSWIRVRLTTLRSLWLLSRFDPDAARPVDPRYPRTLPIQLILRALIGPAYRTSWRLQSVIGNYALNAAVRRGTAGPAFSISGAAMTVAYYTGNYTRGCRHADLVLRNLECHPGQTSYFRARLSVFAFIKAFVHPRRSVLAEMADCRDAAFEHGDVSFALYAENLRGYLMWLVGDPLERMTRTRLEFRELCKKFGSAEWQNSRHLLAVFAALTGSGDATREELDPELLSSPLLLPIRSAWIACYCMLGQYQRAFEESESMLAEIGRVYCNMPHVPEFWLFRGLSAAHLASDAAGRERRRYVRALRRSRHRMRNWAKHGPANFEPAALLLDAESARLSRRTDHALDLYRRSAKSAALNKYPQQEALVHERCGRLLSRLRRDTDAEASLQRAARLYREWGATVAADRLRAD